MGLHIISGGQTGVDRAALDVALELKLPCGGWCPLGRRAEDGRIPKRYPLQEITSINYPVRTRANVRDSDGTLILTRGIPDRGTKLTRDVAARLGKPCLVVDLNRPVLLAVVRKWMMDHDIGVLNVAGPHESSQPGIHAQASDVLRRLLKSPRAKSQPKKTARRKE